jgi:threonine/homoserine/homoserine lactone efflux protein
LNYEILSAFVLATALLSVSPGPDNIYVLMQSIAHGKKYGLATTAGLMTGCLVHTTLLALGVSALIKNNPHIFLIIKIFGAIYLFYLAYRVFRSKAVIQVGQSPVPKKGLGSLYRQGFIMNVLNPKVTVFFLAFFPGFLFSETLGLVWQFYLLGGLFIVVSFTVFAGIALLSGAISNFIRHRSGPGIFLKWVQILVFTGIGIYLLFSEN